MKHLLENGSGTARQPHIGRSFEWIQEAYMESIEAILESIIPDTSGLYIKLYGLELTTGVGTDVTAGAVYYNGEVYLVSAFSGGLPSAGQAVELSFNTSFDAVDPITFTDGTTASVHQNKRMAVSIVTSGAGDVAFTDLVDLRQQLNMNDAGITLFKVYNGDTSAWEATATRNLQSGSFVKAHKLGKKVTLAFKLVMNFNDVTANEIDFACGRLGFDLPTWLQPQENGIIERVVKYRNDASENVVESAYMRIWTGDTTTNAPDFQVFTHGYNVNGGGSIGLVTGISGRPLNYEYPSNATGSQIATSTDFQVQVHGEVTYEAANFDLS